MTRAVETGVEKLRVAVARRALESAGLAVDAWRIGAYGEDVDAALAAVRGKLLAALSDTIAVPRELARRMLDAVWDGQTTTAAAHAAENTVCGHGCGEPYEDFVAHEPDCAFVRGWTDLAEVRAALGDTRQPVVWPAGRDHPSRRRR